MRTPPERAGVSFWTADGPHLERPELPPAPRRPLGRRLVARRDAAAAASYEVLVERPRPDASFKIHIGRPHPRESGGEGWRPEAGQHAQTDAPHARQWCRAFASEKLSPHRSQQFFEDHSGPTLTGSTAVRSGSGAAPFTSFLRKAASPKPPCAGGGNKVADRCAPQTSTMPTSWPSRHRAAKRGNTKESGAETLPASQAECGARRSFATRSLISGNLRGSNASSAYKAESVQQLPDTPEEIGRRVQQAARVRLC